MLSYLVWDPDKNLFVLPYLHHPVSWYGFLFACGVLFGFFLTKKILTTFFLDVALNQELAEKEAARVIDRLSIYMILGTLIGARLGHVFFYDWSYYQHHLGEIFKIWQGGLASHGGALGALAALWLFAKKTRELSFKALVDTLVIPVIFAGGAIRIGNFINQEITGIPATVPWSVIFVHPVDGVPNVPSHPVQLYEACFYFSVFIFLLLLWKRHPKKLGSGLLSGWFFLLVFGFRFLIENLKMPQNLSFDLHKWAAMGQLLSLPFILLGSFFLLNHYKAHAFLKYARKKR